LVSGTEFGEVLPLGLSCVGMKNRWN
jgi:hypothetical protein